MTSTEVFPDWKSLRARHHMCVILKVLTSCLLFIQFQTQLHAAMPLEQNPTFRVPDDVGDAYKLALRHDEAGEYHRELDILQGIQSKHRNFIPIYWDIAVVDYKLHKYHEAIRSMKVYLLYRPAETDALNAVAICYMELKDYQNAIDTYNGALKIDSQNCKLLTNRGKAFLEKGQFEKAVNDFKRVLTIDRDYKYGYTMVGLAYLRLKKVDEAINEFNQAIRTDDADVSALTLQAVCYYGKGKNEMAEKNMAMCYKLFPKQEAFLKEKVEWESLILSGKLVIRYDE